MLRILSTFLCILSLSATAQTCLSSIDPTAPDTNYIAFDDGTVTDTTTGLMWMRCAIGQTYTDGGCVNDPTEYNWQLALQLAHGYQFAGYQGWRLPNVKELSSITERACVRPSINDGIFPNTPSDDFWTSTPSTLDPERAWVVAFFNSSNSIKQKHLFVYVRLVRYAD